MPNPASLDDIERRWRSLTTGETIVALTVLDDAWAILLSKVASLESRLEAETLSESLVVHVLCKMVLRVLRNPDGLRSGSIDDFSYTRDAAVSSGDLYLSADESDLLAIANSSTGTAFTITPYHEADEVDTDILGWAL